MLSIGLVGASFSAFTIDITSDIWTAINDPYIALFIGLLLTALIQSSSTVTAMAVSAVAVGTISYPTAIFIIMGANIGTTITSTLVSIGFISKKSTFNLAVSAGILHDFFNIVMVIIWFPLELHFGILSSLSLWLGGLLGMSPVLISKAPETNFILFKYGDKLFEWIGNAYVALILSFFGVFGGIKIISKLVYSLIVGKSQQKLNKYFFNSSTRSFLWGALLTSGVQSSSITTPLIVPLVATRKVTLQMALPFILGANLGTTITALIIAIIKSPFSIGVALAHMIFNLSGVILFMSIVSSRDAIIYLARRFALLNQNYQTIFLAYVLFIFFILPFILIYFADISSVFKTEVPVEKAANLMFEEKV
ncbi:MAG: Na/Pi cotransporter family protein [Cyclobacteriaceae bacterium]|nr:Na/Pi cotransporter family protein [Cyclobacteriaceae bacterium]